MIARSLPPLVLPALLALAGCGGSETANQATAAPRGDYVAKMQALNEKERNVALFRAIRDAGRTCQQVERSVATDPVAGKAAWVATCDDRSAWLVTLSDDGTATVTDARAIAGRGAAG
ncbi:hypothetical protein KZ813_14630 [Sphingomonas sp. RHCKR7]|uniref:hypothetical protein n=1 Tax=Sphingomonas folli TaxID=2862497 RepID=UPI001CA5AA2D|nr:hypothetical protein [Sphingomonas folli]MBW6528076.1 hypothetical protein [Sphingomonas folli]